MIFVRNVNFERVGLRQLLNLFSVFGQVAKVLSNPPDKQTWIQYRESSQAASALGTLNGLQLFGLRLRANFSLYDNLALKTMKGK